MRMSTGQSVTLLLIAVFVALFCLQQVNHDTGYVYSPAQKAERISYAERIPQSYQASLPIGSSAEEIVHFTSQYGKNSNERLVRTGILVRKPESRATILICHGFMCDKDDVRFLRSIFDNYTTMTFDFRAHGEKVNDQICTLGSREMYDVIGAVDFIKNDPQLKDTPLIVYGFSMGAVASILAQAQEPSLFDAAIWDCPFDSTDNVLGRMIDRIKISIGSYEFGLPGKTYLKKYVYNSYIQEFLKSALKTITKMDTSAVKTCIEPVNTVGAAQKISIPALVITCHNDRKAPPAAVTSVYENLQGYKRLWLTKGRTHFDSFFYSPERYAHRIRWFIEKFLDDKLTSNAAVGIWDDNDSSQHITELEG